MKCNYNYVQARMWQSIHFHDEINNQAILNNMMESHTRIFGLELSQVNIKTLGYIYSMSGARSNTIPYNGCASQIRA